MGATSTIGMTPTVTWSRPSLPLGALPDTPPQPLISSATAAVNSHLPCALCEHMCTQRLDIRIRSDKTRPGEQGTKNKEQRTKNRGSGPKLIVLCSLFFVLPI